MSVDGVWFFGVMAGDSSGHFWYSRGGRVWMSRSEEKEIKGQPWEYIDGSMQVGVYGKNLRPYQGPDSLQLQGQAAFHRKGSWYLIAIWDSSGDRRGGSNSNFLIRTDLDLDFDQAVEISREAFPQIWGRMDAQFEIKLVEDYGRI